MDKSNTEKHQRPSQSELDNVSRGSIVKVSDPDKGVWYWVIIERRLDNHHFFGRIDARCMIWPALRHGGRLTFHQDHILYIWPRKVTRCLIRLGFATYHMFFLSGLVRKWLNGQHRVLILCATRRDSPDALNDSFSSACTTKRPA